MLGKVHEMYQKFWKRLNRKLQLTGLYSSGPQNADWIRNLRDPDYPIILGMKEWSAQQLLGISPLSLLQCWNANVAKRYRWRIDTSKASEIVNEGTTTVYI